MKKEMFSIEISFLRISSCVRYAFVYFCIWFVYDIYKIYVKPIDTNRVKVYEDKKLTNLMVSFLDFFFELSFISYKCNNASSSFLLWSLDQKIQDTWKISTGLNDPGMSMLAVSHMQWPQCKDKIYLNFNQLWQLSHVLLLITLLNLTVNRAWLLLLIVHVWIILRDVCDVGVSHRYSQERHIPGVSIKNEIFIFIKS